MGTPAEFAPRRTRRAAGGAPTARSRGRHDVHPVPATHQSRRQLARDPDRAPEGYGGPIDGRNKENAQPSFTADETLALTRARARDPTTPSGVQPVLLARRRSDGEPAH